MTGDSHIRPARLSRNQQKRLHVEPFQIQKMVGATGFEPATS